MAAFTSIERGDTPEKIAENDYLMKCGCNVVWVQLTIPGVMRVIITARGELAPHYEAILTRLVNIIGQISKNPSNPRFNQYSFESISALIRFVCEVNPAALSTFEAALFGPAEVILAQDVTGECWIGRQRPCSHRPSEFIPYIFQILAQLLELHAPTDLPSEYQQLLGPLLSASLWEQRGNVPALARIWKALLMRGASIVVANNQIPGLLGIFQRLIASKNNDVYGFEILQALYEFVPL